MSRLEPSRELRDFLDTIEARAELARDSESGLPDGQRISHRSFDSRPPEKPEIERERSEVYSRSARAVYYDGDHGYKVSGSEIRSMVELGKFRAISETDLGNHLYGGERNLLKREIENLVRQGLVQRGRFEGSEGSLRTLLTLTKRGNRLLTANRIVARDQVTYSGFVRPREANHDADLYQLYQKEAARIEQKGGRIRRVVLDFEITRKVNRDLARLGSEARPEIAARHGLQVVRNKIPIPDMQIEYETRDGGVARVNLELVTEHYGGQHMAEKARAGFSLYTPRGEGEKLRRVLDQQELTAEILSL